MNPKTSSPSSSDNKLITNETSSSSMIQSSSSSSAATEKTNQFYSQQQNSSSSSSSDGTLIAGDCHSTVLESNSDANLHKQIKDILNQKKMKLMNSPEVVAILRRIQQEQRQHSK